MTMNVALGLAGVPPRSGDRGHREPGPESGTAFGDLVRGSDPKHGKPDRSRSRDDDVREGTGKPFDYHSARLEMRRAAADEAADEAVVDVLAGFLADDAHADDFDQIDPEVAEMPEAELDPATEEPMMAAPAQPAAPAITDEASADAIDPDVPADSRSRATVDVSRPNPAEDEGRQTAAAATDRADAKPDASRPPVEAMPRDERGDGRRAPPADAAAARAPKSSGERSAQPAPQVSTASGASEQAGPDRAKPAGSAATSAYRLAERSPFEGQSRPISLPGQNAGALAGKVNVLGFSAAAAPAPVTMMSPTAAGLVAAMGADPTWRAAAAEPAPGMTRTPNFSSGVNTLRIQLNPAELGMVTARLTATGSQLEIEIRVESNDARQRLANDSDAIVKALRGVGLDVEKLTIQQGGSSSTNPNQSGGGARDQNLAGQQMQSDGNGRDRGNQQSDARDAEDAAAGLASELAAHRTGGGVYI